MEISKQQEQQIRKKLRGSKYDSYKKYAFQKAYDLVIPPAYQQSQWVKQVIDDPERQPVRPILEEFAKSYEVTLERFEELLQEGMFVPDWMCDSQGFYIDMESYHKDQIEDHTNTIDQLNSMLNELDSQQFTQQQKKKIKLEIDQSILKHKKLIGWNNKKLFEFKLKMNTKRQLHEQQVQLENEIKKAKENNNG